MSDRIPGLSTAPSLFETSEKREEVRKSGELEVQAYPQMLTPATTATPPRAYTPAERSIEKYLANPELANHIAFSEDPENERLKALNIYNMRELLGLTGKEISTHYDAISEKYFGPNVSEMEKGRQVELAKTYGQMVNEKSEIGARMMYGTVSQDDLDRLDVINATLPNMDMTKIEGLGDLPHAAVVAFWKNYGIMSSAMMEGASESMAAGLGAAIPAAYVAGKAGALAGTAFIPGIGTAIGGGVGATGAALAAFFAVFGGAKTATTGSAIARKEAGLIYLDIVGVEGEGGEKIPLDIARNIAIGAGALSGLTETTEMLTMLAGAPLATKFLKDNIGKVMEKILAAGSLKDIAAKAFLKYGLTIGSEIQQEIAQEGIGFVARQLAINLATDRIQKRDQFFPNGEQVFRFNDSAAQDAQPFMDSNVSIKEVVDNFIMVSMETALLSGSMAIGPRTIAAINDSVKLQGVVKDAVREVVIGQEYGAYNMEGSFEALRANPALAALSDPRIEKLLVNKYPDMNVNDTARADIQADARPLAELHLEEAQKAYDKYLVEFEQSKAESGNANKKPMAFDSFELGYMASVGRATPPSAWSNERISLMYQQHIEGSADAGVDPMPAQDYYKMLKDPNMAYEELSSKPGQNARLSQMGDAVKVFREIFDELEISGTVYDEVVRGMLDDFEANVDYTTNTLGESQAILEQKEVTGYEIEAAESMIQDLKDQAETAATPGERIGAINEIVTTSKKIAELHRVLKDDIQLLKDSGWKDPRILQEVMTAKDLELVENEAIRMRDLHIERLQEVKAMDGVTRTKIEQVNELIAELRDLNSTAKARINDFTGLLEQQYHAQYKAGKRLTELNETAGNLEYLLRVIDSAEYKDLIKGEGILDQLNKEEMQSVFIDKTWGELEYEGSKWQKRRLPRELVVKYGDERAKLMQFDLQKRMLASVARKSFANRAQRAHDTLIAQINKQEVSGITAQRERQIQALKSLVGIGKIERDDVIGMMKSIEVLEDNLIDPEMVYVPGEFTQEIMKLVEKAMYKSPEGQQMSIADLEQIKQAIDFIRHLGKKEMALAKDPPSATKARLTDRILEKLKGKGIEEIPGTTGYKDKITGPRNLIRSARGLFRMPNDMWRRVGGQEAVDFFVKEKHVAFNEKAKRLKVRQSWLDVLLKDTGFKVKDFYKKKTVDGREMVVQDLMGIYLGMKDLHARNAITAQPELVVIASNIENHLTVEEKLVADEISKNWQEQWPKLSEAYQKLTGKRLGRIDAYMPIVRVFLDFDSIEEEVADTFLFGTDKHESGIYKKFVEKRMEIDESKQKSIKLGVLDLWTDLVHKHEHFIASAELVSVMKKVLGDPDVSHAIESAYGAGIRQQLNGYVQGVANPAGIHGTKMLDKIVRFLGKNTVFAGIAYAFQIIPRQVFSGPLVTMYTGWSNYLEAGNEFMRHPIKSMNWVKEVAPSIITSGIEVEILNTPPKNLVGGRKALKKYQDSGYWGIKMADQVTKAIGFMAVVKANEATMGKEKAIREGLYIIDLTQPSSDRTSLPSAYRHSAFTNWLLMFSQQPLKIFNLLTVEMGQKMIESKQDKRAMVEALYGLMAIALSVGGIWIMKNRRFPENPEDYIDMLLSGTVGNIPIVGKEVVKGFSGQWSAPSSAYAFPNALGKLFKDVDTDEKLEAVFKAAESVTGLIPRNGMDKVGQAIEEKSIVPVLLGGMWDD